VLAVSLQVIARPVIGNAPQSADMAADPGVGHQIFEAALDSPH
jgi:hypothetical protein